MTRFFYWQAAVGLQMVFLNGTKTSGMVKLSFSIQVTCLIMVFRCRGTRYAPKSDGRGEQSDIRR